MDNINIQELADLMADYCFSHDCSKCAFRVDGKCQHVKEIYDQLCAEANED